MYNALIEDASGLSVIENGAMARFKRYLIYFLVLMCVFFSYNLIKYLDTKWSYASIPASLLIIAYYQFIYLKPSGRGRCIFSVNTQEIYYNNSNIELIIPITSVDHIRDDSAYHEFPGKGNRGWNNAFTIFIRPDTLYFKLDADSIKKEIESTDNTTVSVFGLNLEHDVHKKLFDRLCEMIG